MAQMQWLGNIPKENSTSYLADAIKEGTQAYVQTKLNKEKHQLALKELDVKERTLAEQVRTDTETLKYEKERDTAVLAQRTQEAQQNFTAALGKLDIEKKKALANTLLDSLNMMDEQKAQQFLSQPEVAKIFESAGMPLPTGAFGVRPKEAPNPIITSIAGAIDRWGGTNTRKSNIKSITPLR